jgi:hypothetical protein
MAAHLAAKVDVRQVGGHNSVIYTWGLPTTGAQWVPGQQMPGNGASGNTPAFQATGWSVLAQGDTCVPEFLPGAQDRCVQVQGVAGGATVSLLGSNDGANWVALTDRNAVNLGAIVPNPQGVLVEINETTAWIMPQVNGGSGGTAINVIMVTRQPS